jgi:hypothetical protein
MGFDKTSDPAAEGHHKRWLRWPSKRKEKYLDAGSTGTASSSTLALALHDPEKAGEEDECKSLSGIEHMKRSGTRIRNWY